MIIPTQKMTIYSLKHYLVRNCVKWENDVRFKDCHLRSHHATPSTTDESFLYLNIPQSC